MTGASGAERLDTIKQLVDRATEVSTAARAQFVRQACDDSSMAAEILSLVAHDTGTPPWPESPLMPELPSPDAACLEPGRSLGRYRVERQLGEGGMGLVALASRAQDFEKQVALKVIRGPLTEPSVRRFERERQILANLEHPGIARLLDGGRLDDGRPWLAMEYVDGMAIDRYCDEHALGIRERIALVVEVCEALDAAHRLQVVHRDIKPSNILVTADGRPRLLDFGIAKELEDDVTDPSGPTGPSGQPMTLRWAAPEQINFGPVTPATDVHGLGLLLYRLLTGRHAFAGATRAELAVAISERVPTQPSAVVGDPALRRELRGDLDVIVGKALAKDPVSRYASAGALGQELRRVLATVPTRAASARCAFICLVAARAISQLWVTLASMTSGEGVWRHLVDFAQPCSCRRRRQECRARRIPATVAATIFSQACLVAWTIIDRQDLRADPARFFGDLIESASCIARDQHQLATGTGKHAGGDHAEGARGPGDQGHLALHVEHRKRVRQSAISSTFRGIGITTSILQTWLDLFSIRTFLAGRLRCNCPSHAAPRSCRPIRGSSRLPARHRPSRTAWNPAPRHHRAGTDCKPNPLVGRDHLLRSLEAEGPRRRNGWAPHRALRPRNV